MSPSRFGNLATARIQRAHRIRWRVWARYRAGWAATVRKIITMAWHPPIVEPQTVPKMQESLESISHLVLCVFRDLLQDLQLFVRHLVVDEAGGRCEPADARERIERTVVH